MRSKSPELMKEICTFVGSYYRSKGSSPSLSEIAKGVGIDDESIWRQINSAVKKTFGLWFYKERSGDIRCLCPQCLSDYFRDTSIVVRRVDPLKREKDHIYPNTIRLSIGTEHIDDILADLKLGFDAAKEE